MTTSAQTTLSLPDAVDSAHAEAREALGQDALTAVAWCSAHLVAVERVLHPAASRHLPDARSAVQAAWSADRELERAVHRLDRRLTGDVHLAEVPVEQLEADVERCLRVHEGVEQRLVDALERALDDDQRSELAALLVDATGRAPTRPHPHVSRTHLAAHLGHTVESWVDRWRDLLDNRAVPGLGAAPTPKTPGKWSYYLAGVPFPAEPRRDDDGS